MNGKMKSNNRKNSQNKLRFYVINKFEFGFQALLKVINLFHHFTVITRKLFQSVKSVNSKIGGFLNQEKSFKR